VTCKLLQYILVKFAPSIILYPPSPIPGMVPTGLSVNL
jgi:hypothetical protein